MAGNLWGHLDLNGTVTRGPVNVPVDVGFSTLLDKLNAAFTIHGETQRGPIGVGADYFYFGLGETAMSTPVPAFWGTRTPSLLRRMGLLLLVRIVPDG